MSVLKKINPSSKANPDTGFGVQASQLGHRFVNKDGSFNIKKEGISLWDKLSIYSWLLDLSWTKFFLIIFSFYVFINVVFAGIYMLIGIDELQGLENVKGTWNAMKEAFFFSTETFTTVGYGRINPDGDGADLVASIEALSGWLAFALVTGLLYGRFTQPKAYLLFSENALISPYQSGTGLMFRLAPYKSRHHLTDAHITVNIAFMQVENEKPVYQFYRLKLERDRVDALTMNWTVVHPIDEESPLLNFTKEDMNRQDLELYVQVTGFDHIFSNKVMQRTSYTFEEIVWGAKFKPMYYPSEDGSSTILQLHKVNDFDTVVMD